MNAPPSAPAADKRTLHVRVIESLQEVEAQAWDSCSGGDPFTSHAFLSALEDSGSAVPKTGWGTSHLLLEDKAGKLLGCVPTWFKSHSRGEYVFDHVFADALMRGGIPYYPKLLAAVPFTPVSGRRLLAAPDAPPETRRVLLEALLELCRKAELSSLHINFLTPQEADLCEQAGLAKRAGCQFIWRNQGYDDFDGFLASLSSRHRKSIRRERAKAQASGLELAALTGDEITEALWDSFWHFYQDTGARKWGAPYLTRNCFSLLSERMGERLLLALAMDSGRPVAGALHVIGTEALYGRYWGSLGYHPFLHFELCYYQAIDYAIAHRLARVEAGAQGGHKLERGYAPETTWSAHYFAHPGLAEAAAAFLTQEGEAVDREIGMLEHYAPFRKDKGA